ncbi:MAG: putative Ig domain-containing protein, partial [Pseudomonadota bacterium]
MNLFRKWYMKVVEPVSIFEQLEERVLLDATINQVDTNPAMSAGSVTVDQDQTMTADAQTNNEGSDGYLYTGLQVDGMDVATHNSTNDPLVADVILDADFATNGKFSWTPNNLDVGSHTFSVARGDGIDPTPTDTESFNVTVNNINPEIAGPFTPTMTAQQGPQSFNIDLVHNQDEGAGLTYSSANLPAWLTLDADTGMISGNPGVAQVGTHFFDVTADDGHGTLDTEQIDLTVDNVLDFTSANTHSSAEDSQLLFDAQTDTETLGLNPVTYSLTGGPAWAVIDSSTGVISGNPENQQVGTYNFTINATSAEGGASQAFTLIITNDEPSIVNPANYVMKETSNGYPSQYFDVESKDEGQSLAATPYSITAVEYNGTAVAIPSWLSIDKDTGIVLGSPKSDDVGQYYVTVAFDDGNGAANSVATHDFGIRVDNIDNYFEGPTETIWTEDVTGQTFDVGSHEENASGSTVTYEIVSGPAWLSIDADTGVLTQIGPIDNSMVTDHVVQVKATEGFAGAVGITQNYTIHVTNVAPVITSASTAGVQEDASGASAIIPVTLDFNEPGVTFSIDDPPSIQGTLFSIVKIDDQHANIIVPMPHNVDVDGVYVFNVIADDGHGGVATKFYQVTITNRVPVFTDLPAVAGSPSLPTLTVTEDSGISFNINDPTGNGGQNQWDTDEGDGPTTYSLSGAPSFLTIDSSTGFIYGTPDNTHVGTHVFTVILNDGHGGQATQQIRIIVNNLVPTFPDPIPITWYEDGDTDQDGTQDQMPYQSFDLNLAGSSTDEGQGAVYTMTGAPAWLNIDAGSGLLSASPSNVQVGAFTFNVTLDDGHGGSVTKSVTLTIENSPPVFDGVYGSGSTTLYVDLNGGSQTFDFQTTDEIHDRPAAQGGPNSYFLAAGANPVPAGVTINSLTGELIVADPSAVSPASASFKIGFFDGTATVYKDIQLIVTTIPPSATDPVNFDPGFFSPNNTTFLEDYGQQTFDIQHNLENSATPVVYELIGAPAGVTFVDTGTQTGSSSGVITLTPTNVHTTDVNPGAYTFTIRVKDAGTLATIVDASFDLQVTNNEPLFSSFPDTVVFTEDVSYAVGTTPWDVETTDEPHNNASNPNEYTLLAGADAIPTWLKIDSLTGKIYVDKGVGDPFRNTIVNSDDYGPGVDGDWDLFVQFDDGHGGIISRAITISIGNVLSFTDPGHGYSVIWQEDTASPFINFFATTNDDSFETVAYPVTYDDLTGVPSWLTGKIAIDHATGQISTTAGVTPDNSIPGVYTLTITAHDGHGSNTQTLTITVPNRDPVFTLPALTMVEDGGPDVINLFTDDEDDARPPAVYYTWTGAPQFMTLDSATGEITADPTNKHVGSYTVTVTAWDLQGRNDFGYIDVTDADGIQGFTTTTFTITVVNAAPLFTSAATATATEDSPFSYDVNMNDEGDGRAGDAFTNPQPAVDPYYQLIGEPSWLTIDAKTGIMSGTPTNPDVGTVVFTVRAFDGNKDGLGNPVYTDQSFTLNVNNRLSYYESPSPGYTFELTEDLQTKRFNLLSEDEGQHVSGGGTTQAGAVYYYLDPAIVPPGVRFEADGT